MATFPLPYKEAIQSSNLSHDQIATVLKIQKRRWQSIFCGHTKMSPKEYEGIKSLVEKIQRKTL